MENNLKEFENESFDIIIQAGQSNAEGCGYGDTVCEYKPREDILYLTDKNPLGWEGEKFKCNPEPALNIEAAKERERQGKLGEFSLSFARKYLEEGCLQSDRKLLIIRAAEGGTSFSAGQWGMTDVLYLRMLKMIDAALALNKNNRIVGFLWHQGESDAVNGLNPAVYQQNLTKLFTSVRERYNLPQMPIITGGFCDEWESQNHAICKPITDAIQAVCAEIGYAVYVQTADLKSNNQQIADGDTIHFSRDALYILGERYFEAWEKVKD